MPRLPYGGSPRASRGALASIVPGAALAQSVRAGRLGNCLPVGRRGHAGWFARVVDRAPPPQVVLPIRVSGRVDDRAGGACSPLGAVESEEAAATGQSDRAVDAGWGVFWVSAAVVARPAVHLPWGVHTFSRAAQPGRAGLGRGPGRDSRPEPAVARRLVSAHLPVRSDAGSALPKRGQEPFSGLGRSTGGWRSTARADEKGS